MLYHYTTALAATLVRRERLLRAHHVTVYADLDGPVRGDAPIILAPPVVWLSSNPIMDLSVVVRETFGGLSLANPGDFWRFAVADEVAPLSMPEWAEKHGNPPDLFRWMVATVDVCGSHYTTWRLAEQDVPAALWLAVEHWNGWQWVQAGEVHA